MVSVRTITAVAQLGERSSPTTAREVQIIGLLNRDVADVSSIDALSRGIITAVAQLCVGVFVTTAPLER